MDIGKAEIEEIINVIDWAISAGYNLNKNKIIIDILAKMVREVDLNKRTANYYKERYCID